MKRIFLILAIALCAASLACAQQRNRDRRVSDDERQQWLAELRIYKHEFLANELTLTKEQQDQFFPVYDQMDDELSAIASETRDLESSLEQNSLATDEELEAGALALFNQKDREANIELAYFDKFKEILTPRQLFRLKNAERKFTQQLVKRHHGRKDAK